VYDTSTGWIHFFAKNAHYLILYFFGRPPTLTAIDNIMVEILRSGSGDLTTPLSSNHSSGSFATLSSKLDSITTEGWLELFLNAAEKRTFSRWQEEINDKSLTHRATKNTFDRIAGLIPDNVAPNVITAAGL
jgi:hypothetical protein